MLEALQRGVPVACSDRSSLPEVAGDAALLFDPDDPAAIAAAIELVENGVNGFVVSSAEPDELADAIVRVDAAGEALRASTCAWFARNARRLSLASSLEKVAASYADNARS